MAWQDEEKIDVLMCVGEGDVEYLMSDSVRSCLERFTLLNKLVIVTCVKPTVIQVLRREGLSSVGRDIVILEDDEVLPEQLHRYPGWCKQQAIKLHADRICGTPIVACLGADTILLQSVLRQQLFEGISPILYYNRYPHTSVHLAYERRRVANVAQLLQVDPKRSLPLGDFIMDLMLFERGCLRGLRCYLEGLYGQPAFERILPHSCETMNDKALFGEWTLYAVYLLDVLGADVPLRNSRNRFLAQVHTAKDFADFDFGATVVHFVNKGFDRDRIRREITQAASEARLRGPEST